MYSPLRFSGSGLFPLRSRIRVSQIGATIPGPAHKAVLTAFHSPSLSNGQFFLPLAILAAVLPFSCLNLVLTWKREWGSDSLIGYLLIPVLHHLFTARDEGRAKSRQALLHVGQSKHRQHWGSDFRADYTLLTAKLQPHLDGNRVVGCAVRELQSVIGADCCPHCALPLIPSPPLPQPGS